MHMRVQNNLGQFLTSNACKLDQKSTLTHHKREYMILWSESTGMIQSRNRCKGMRPRGLVLNIKTWPWRWKMPWMPTDQQQLPIAVGQWSVNRKKKHGQRLQNSTSFLITKFNSTMQRKPKRKWTFRKSTWMCSCDLSRERTQHESRSRTSSKCKWLISWQPIIKRKMTSTSLSQSRESKLMLIEWMKWAQCRIRKRRKKTKISNSTCIRWNRP